MSYIQLRHRRPFDASTERFIELLEKYPHVPPVEIEEMVGLYSRLTILDLGLLSSDSSLSLPLDSFVAKHSQRLKSWWKDHLVFAVTMIGTLALLVGLAAFAFR
ncbi:hypothetical protein [Sphingobium nicotianae]|nr:hypothetical protein [Sphingobium nicotianae]